MRWQGGVHMAPPAGDRHAHVTPLLTLHMVTVHPVPVGHRQEVFSTSAGATPGRWVVGGGGRQSSTGVQRWAVGFPPGALSSGVPANHGQKVVVGKKGMGRARQRQCPVFHLPVCIRWWKAGGMRHAVECPPHPNCRIQSRWNR